jgi:hypothetical protein
VHLSFRRSSIQQDTKRLARRFNREYTVIRINDIFTEQILDHLKFYIILSKHSLFIHPNPSQNHGLFSPLSTLNPISSTPSIRWPICNIDCLMRQCRRTDCKTRLPIPIIPTYNIWIHDNKSSLLSKRAGTNGR